MNHEQAWSDLKEHIEWELEFQQQKYSYLQNAEIKVALKKAEYFLRLIKHLEEKHK